MKHSLPIQWDEEHPDDWVCWGVVGPSATVRAAALGLDARLRELSSRPPTLALVSLEQGLEMICYSEELFSFLRQLDEETHYPESPFLQAWLAEASVDSTLVDIHAYSHGESYWGEAAKLWRNGKMIWQSSSVGVIDKALDSFRDSEIEAELRADDGAQTQAASYACEVWNASEHGRVLAFVLQGAIPHDDSKSATLYQSLSHALRDAIAQDHPGTVILDLRGFQYSLGNEIAAILLTPFVALAASGGGKMAIVATGPTAANLNTLLRSGNLDRVLGTVHPDRGAALSHLTRVPPLNSPQDRQ